MSIVEDMARAMAEASVAMQDVERSTPTHLNWEDLGDRERRWFNAFASSSLHVILSGPVGDVLQLASINVDESFWKEGEMCVNSVLFGELDNAVNALPEEITTILEDRG